MVFVLARTIGSEEDPIMISVDVSGEHGRQHLVQKAHEALAPEADDVPPATTIFTAAGTDVVVGALRDGAVLYFGFDGEPWRAPGEPKAISAGLPSSSSLPPLSDAMLVEPPTPGRLATPASAPRLPRAMAPTIVPMAIDEISSLPPQRPETKAKLLEQMTNLGACESASFQLAASFDFSDFGSLPDAAVIDGVFYDATAERKRDSLWIIRCTDATWRRHRLQGPPEPLAIISQCIEYGWFRPLRPVAEVRLRTHARMHTHARTHTHISRGSFCGSAVCYRVVC
jgi:hypothetical protein